MESYHQSSYTSRREKAIKMGKFVDMKRAMDIYYEIYDPENHVFVVPENVTMKEILMTIRTFGKELYKMRKFHGRPRQEDNFEETSYTKQENTSLSEESDSMKIWSTMDAPEYLNIDMETIEQSTLIALVPKNYVGSQKISPVLSGFKPVTKNEDGSEIWAC